MNEEKKTVLVFTAGDYTTASSKYRAFLLGRYLSEMRSDIVWNIVEPSTKDVSSMPVREQLKTVWRQMIQLFWFPRHSALFLQRPLYNKFIFLALIVQNILRIRPSIFDLDDATFIHSPLKTRWFMKTSTVVIVGSHSLYDYARQYNHRVVLIPTSIKFSDYAHLEREEHSSGDVTLGWIGNAPSYIPELRFLGKVLEKLSQKGFRYRLLLIGTYGAPHIHQIFDFIPEDQKSIVPYVDAKTDADLVPYFSRMNIGLMPLDDSEWNRGKCAFKAVQYMAAGGAVLASPVGENSFLITDRKTGMLASTEGEWVERLSELITDRALRTQLGMRAQAHVREYYSYESQCAAVAGVIDSL